MNLNQNRQHLRNCMELVDIANENLQQAKNFFKGSELLEFRVGVAFSKKSLGGAITDTLQCLRLCESLRLTPPPTLTARPTPVLRTVDGRTYVMKLQPHELQEWLGKGWVVA